MKVSLDIVPFEDGYAISINGQPTERKPSFAAAFETFEELTDLYSTPEAIDGVDPRVCRCGSPRVTVLETIAYTELCRCGECGSIFDKEL